MELILFAIIRSRILSTLTVRLQNARFTLHFVYQNHRYLPDTVSIEYT